MLHKSLLEFTRKYNKEFAIKGYSKLRKSELQQKIESVLNKQRKEIKEEYKLLKATATPVKKPVKKPVVKKTVKKPVKKTVVKKTVKKPVVKKTVVKKTEPKKKPEYKFTNQDIARLKDWAELHKRKYSTMDTTSKKEILFELKSGDISKQTGNNFDKYFELRDKLFYKMYPNEEEEPVQDEKEKEINSKGWKKYLKLVEDNKELLESTKRLTGATKGRKLYTNNYSWLKFNGGVLEGVGMNNDKWKNWIEVVNLNIKKIKETKPKPAVKKPVVKKPVVKKPTPKKDKEELKNKVMNNPTRQLIQKLNTKPLYEKSSLRAYNQLRELPGVMNKGGVKTWLESKLEKAKEVNYEPDIKLINESLKSVKIIFHKIEQKPKPTTKKEPVKKYKKVFKVFDEYYKLGNIELKKYLKGLISDDKLDEKLYTELNDEYDYKGLAVSLGLYKDIRGSRTIDPNIEKKLKKESKNYKEFLKLIKQEPKKEPVKKEKKEKKSTQRYIKGKVEELTYKIANNPNYIDSYSNLTNFLQKTKDKNIFPLELTFAFTQKQNDENFKALDSNPKLFIDFMAEIAKDIKDSSDLKFNIIKKIR